MRNALLAARNGHAHRMIAVQALIRADEHLPIGCVLYHADLLIDNAAFLLHVFIREVRREHEFKQNLQILLKPVGAGKVIRRHSVACEGVRTCTGAGEFLQCIAVLILEHLMLKEVRNARRCVIPLALKGERCVHRTEIGRQNGEGLAEALLGQIADTQTVCQRAGLHTLVQSGIILCHFAAPFIKNTVSSAVLCAATMTCSRVMSVTCSMRSSGDTSVPAAACPIQ